MSEPNGAAVPADSGDRSLAWEGCYNVRDLGGLETVDGKRIAYGALLRADNLCALTELGQAALRAHGVGTILDLRTTSELARAPHPFAAGHAENPPVYIHAPILDEANADTMARLNATDSVADLYEGILERCAPLIGAALRVVAQAGHGGVLVHCHVGKDRTGLIIALLLGLADVPVAAIAADYALSDRYLQPVYARILAGSRDSPAVHAQLVKYQSAHADAMTRSLRFLTERYGGVEAYTRFAGLQGGDIDAIRTRLLA